MIDMKLLYFVLGKVQPGLCSEQQYPRINEMHQITSRWPDFWSSTERTVGHVSGSCTQVELEVVS